MTNVTILGAGAWGTALAELVQGQGHPVQVWSRQQDLEVVANAAVVISALPMTAVRSVAARIPLADHAILVSTTKGLEAGTVLTPSAIWQSYFPKHAVVVLSGPNLASEIRAKKPAAAVVAGPRAQEVQKILACERFRVYLNNDPQGVELGGALKNVVAISAGVSDGLDLGTNAKSALITRGLAEVIRIGVLLGGQAETFYGLAGLGDLLTTCTSPLSRNYQVGFRLATHPDLLAVLRSIEGVAEGVNTARVLVQLAQQRNLELPIAQQVCALLDGKTTPQTALGNLMARSLKEELNISLTKP
ncbi:NAD(P)H-dependent glycerol-3-phosphate dehydrogenase [Candidatus Cyanaurora vandensis]|uniref:NAD(P)H-dependent glycerol-3-phosphate dehydrogenase n=1 Tax=Candidatus Cyanaurora vandensis TaxID=2714958 RepID=UPI00257E7408|nr:NAD(P)H-dependent glycerol-3-phosphate dehydrogenase [Candidatus Cyanaurora vandensis]